MGAVKCLMELPAERRDLWPGARSRYDDFQGLHITVTEQVHFNGPFLPWHRWMMLFLFESELRSKCSYKGSLPYWDFSLDNTPETFMDAPVFDDVYGFGGNGPYVEDVSNEQQFPSKTPTEIAGRTGGGASLEHQPHCLGRDFNPTLAAGALSDEIVERALSPETPTMYSSPGDPLFYFIHGSLDKIWNDWQRRDWPARKTAIGGPDAMFAFPVWLFRDRSLREHDLAVYPLSYPGFGKDMLVSEVMDMRGGPFCYEYQ
ncbi:N-acetyl-6-hydroxytryptophan oxidase ivoB [Colletotrichum trifolii]|uniref:N-acetyl-6-hydroxytryptophan oxidase ivoB n=1 Tax=Colletotrichum trifolii TaxID=5466 RepID=A0A4R8RS48_COLTR|nr:N-acetyl-6-hydroxytryptophan oxidase ivoB [Colletotrichum trifolii]